MIRKVLPLIAAAALAFAPTVAVAQSVCSGDLTQPDTVDLSNGQGTLCFPVNLESGDPIPVTKVLDCTVVFKDGAGQEISTQSFTGTPGSEHTVTVPRDGVGTAVLSCVLDGLSSTAAASPPTVIFPSITAPSRPIVLPAP